MLLAGPLPVRTGEAVTREMADLEAAGVVRGDRLLAWAAELVAVVAAPDLRLTVITAAGAHQAVTEVWARPSGAAVGEVAEDATVTCRSTEPSLLAWTLADLVHLGDRPSPIGADVRIDATRLARFDELVAAGNERGAVALLTDGEPEPTGGMAAMVALASDDRRAWRITSTWTDGAGAVVVRWLAVIDGGHGGLWRSEAPAPLTDADGAPVEVAPADVAVTLVSTTAADTWQRLVDLLPPGAGAFPPHLDPAHPGRAPCPPSSPPIQIDSSASSKGSPSSTPA